MSERIDSEAVKAAQRDFASWVLPEAWHGPVSEIVYRIRRRSFLRRLSANEILRGRHRDVRRCFVIGNGPSLNSLDLSPLAREITVVANSFFQHPLVATINPTYCCVGDYRFIVDQPNAIAWLRELESKLPTTTLFFRPWAPELFKKYGIFRHHAIYFIDSVAKVAYASQVHVDLVKPLNVGYTTGSGFSIPLALFLGFPEIYLIGFDANWLADPHHGALHFYNTNSYFPQFDHTMTEGLPFEEHLRTAHLEFRSHRLLREVARRQGQRILNATNGGWLDMYERVNYTALF